MQGVKIILKSKNGQVLGLRSKESCDLPSCSVENVSELRDATRELFKQTTGNFPEQDLIPAYRGYDDEFGVSSSYVSEWNGKPKNKKGQKAEFVDIVDIMCGQWGLFARDAFNRLKLLNRPKLNVEELYSISRRALDEGSRYATEGVDKVIDEICFLVDIKKTAAVDSLIQNLDVHKLHADILSSITAAIEELDLPSKHIFMEKAEAVIREIDALRPKMVLKDEWGRILSHDVRGDALKYYRNKAAEFGKQLRAGTLGQGIHRGGSPLPRKKAN